jgi:hypothetical protein
MWRKRAPSYLSFVFTEVGAVALMIAMFSGALALLVASTQGEHTCPNRFCPKRRRQPHDPPDRP